MSTATTTPFLTTPPTAASARSTPPPTSRAGWSRTAQSLAVAALRAVTVVAVVRHLGAGDLVAALAGASPGWLAVAAGASLLPFAGAALSLAAFTPGRLPLRRTTAVQVASSVAGVILPPTVGQLAVNARYLHTLGHGPAAVTAAVALTQASSVAVALVLLAAALAATSTSLALGGSATTTVAVVGSVVIGLAVTSVLTPRSRRAGHARLTRPLSELGPRLHQVATEPARIASGIGGSLLVSGGYVFALDACLRSVSTTLPLAQTAIVVLAGTALGSAAPTPGGTVAVEVALTTGLVTAGVPVATALPAVLLHRATTLWLRVSPGLVAITVLRRRGWL